MASIRTRALQRADRAAARDLLERGTHWEVVEEARASRVFEVGGRIVAIASGARRLVAAPRWAPEPVPVVATAYDAGEEIGWVGQLLVIAPTLSVAYARTVHRLARTLAAQEIGARWVFVSVPLPRVDGLGPAAVLQQITAGALAHPPVEIPLSDGYWSIGIRAEEEGHAVLVRRNDEF